MSLLYISQQLTIYGGIFLLVVGVIGNGINIFIFLSIQTYRTTPSSFYFLVGSINNILHLLINLTYRILSVGYGINLVNRSIVWCKTRSFLITTLTLISFTCSCLAAIDQFLVTSRCESFRRFSQIKWAHRILFLIIIIWCLHGIPYLVYLDISPITHTCVNTNTIFNSYTIISLFILLCGIPVILLILFGYLSYRNIHRIIIDVDQRVDRQLTKMTLIQAALVIISVIPYGIMNAYALITISVVKDINQQMKEYLISTIVNLISYLNFAGNFYVFLITSNRFRHIVKDRLCCWGRTRRIHPF